MIMPQSKVYQYSDMCYIFSVTVAIGCRHSQIWNIWYLIQHLSVMAEKEQEDTEVTKTIDSNRVKFTIASQSSMESDTDGGSGGSTQQKQDPTEEGASALPQRDFWSNVNTPLQSSRHRKTFPGSLSLADRDQGDPRSDHGGRYV